MQREKLEKIPDDFRFFHSLEDKDILIEEIKKIIGDKSVSGLVIQLPLPKHINTQYILNAIPPKKDVDVLSSEAQKKFYAGNFSVLPPAVGALRIVMNKIGLDPKNKKAAVFGQGLLIGKPTVYWLKSVGAEVFEIDEFTMEPKQYSIKADIIVSGVGKPNLITGDMVKGDVSVFDFGYGKKDGQTMGDVDFASVSPKCRHITPVPGGIGPLVVVSVLKNLVELNS